MTTYFHSLQISDPDKCDQMYESLARINGNVYKQKVSDILKLPHLFYVKICCCSMKTCLCCCCDLLSAPFLHVDGHKTMFRPKVSSLLKQATQGQCLSKLQLTDMENMRPRAPRMAGAPWLPLFDQRRKLIHSNGIFQIIQRASLFVLALNKN